MFENISPALRQPGMVDMDLGQALAQATLMAIEQGLGCCCQASANWKKLEKAFGFSEDQHIVVVQTVGYPAESKEAGGQFVLGFLSRSCSSTTPSTTPSPVPSRWWMNLGATNSSKRRPSWPGGMRRWRSCAKNTTCLAAG